MPGVCLARERNQVREPRRRRWARARPRYARNRVPPQAGGSENGKERNRMQERHAGRLPPFAACGPGGLRRNLAPASLPGRGQADPRHRGGAAVRRSMPMRKTYVTKKKTVLVLIECDCQIAVVRFGSDRPPRRSGPVAVSSPATGSAAGGPPHPPAAFPCGRCGPRRGKAVVKCARDGASKSLTRNSINVDKALRAFV